MHANEPVHVMGLPPNDVVYVMVSVEPTATSVPEMLLPDTDAVEHDEDRVPVTE